MNPEAIKHVSEIPCIGGPSDGGFADIAHLAWNESHQCHQWECFNPSGKIAYVYLMRGDGNLHFVGVKDGPFAGGGA